VPTLTSLITEAGAQWDPVLERALFGTAEPARIAEALESFVGTRCGPVADAVFYRPGVGIVAGLRLLDSSEVVLKVHRWNVTVARLRAVHQVQSLLADAGLPAPRPLAGPEELGGGIATVEALQRGTAANGRDPDVRRALAEGLHAFVAAASPLVGRVDVGPPLMIRPPGAPLWFEPHDVRFDLEGTAAGAEWIDELATLARHRLERMPAGDVIGHFDWRIQNLAFDGAAIVGIYDWDSVAAAPEAVVVGNTAALFTADWSSDEPDPLPSLGDMRAFVRDYEVARGRRFDGAELEAADAANLFLCAYGARCQHSDATRHPELGRGVEAPFFRLLRERGERGLLVA
jgi:hypothetical protein